jgi:hypothetical protein
VIERSPRDTFAPVMRSSIMIVMLSALACGNSEKAGIEEAQKQAEAELKAKEASGEVAKKINPPVAGRAKLSCAQVIDVDLFTKALGEKDPIRVADGKDPDAPATCMIVRGGAKRPTDAEQKALLKQNGKLGVLVGDEICTVTTYCWTIEDADRFHKRCLEDKTHTMDEGLGFPSCVWIVPTGEADVKHFRFFDDDTKCLFDVRAGPSNTDNDLIGRCAKAAHDLIGPTQIAVKP